jgi:2-alkyl-3-oxoalkanoate reductase
MAASCPTGSPSHPSRPDVTGAVAVTGATGFIGRHVVAALRAAGHPVRVLVRAGRAVPPGTSAVTGALDDQAALARLLEGAQTAVNCAGAVRGATRADFAAVNEAPLAALLDAARARGAALVHLSSLAAREAALSDYAASKAAGEALIAAAGVPATVLRPSAVYGPGERELRPLLDAMRRGLALVPGPVHARFSLLYVEDLAAAVCRAVEGPPTGGVHELDDGMAQGYDWPALARAMTAVTGRRVRVLHLPARALRAAAAANLRLARATRRAPMLTPGKARELRHPDWVVRERSFCALTAWRPQVGLEAGLARTLAA